MIEPIGTVFQTIPVAYFNVLDYLADAESETVWGSGLVEIDDAFWPLSGAQGYNGPTAHGLAQVFYGVAGGFYDISLFGAAHDSNDETAPQLHHGIDDNPIGVTNGGMDDFPIMRPNDLFERWEYDPDNPKDFGKSWTRSDECYAVLYNTGFTADGIPEGGHQAWIFGLEPDPAAPVTPRTGANSIALWANPWAEE